MATYARIERATDLPVPALLSERARERGDLDCKVFADKAKMAEHAKDVAAFANGLGGVLLVGAELKSDELFYVGIKGQIATEIAELYEHAGRLCSPPHAVSAIRIEQAPGVVVVAVNVDPAVDHLVASPGTDVAQKQSRPKEIPWRFPRRTSSQTDYIEPEKLPMYMNAEIRRAYLLLQSVPAPARQKIRVHHHAIVQVAGKAGVTSAVFELSDVQLERNAITVSLAKQGGGKTSCRVPLLDVLDVWEEVNGEWQLEVAGHVFGRKGVAGEELEYMPLRSAGR